VQTAVAGSESARFGARCRRVPRAAAMSAHVSALELEPPRGAPRTSESHALSDGDDVPDDAAQELLRGDAAPGGLHRTFRAWVNEERAVTASWLVNWALFIFKIIAFAISNSKAVLASLADSAVDLASQGVLASAQRHIKLHDERYPVGRARLEAFAVLACGTIMIMASVEVIQFSIMDLWRGTHGDLPRLHVDAAMFTILGLGIAVKAVLWVVCRAAAAQNAGGAGTLEALAEDHLNDVWSNAGAVITGAIAGTHPVVWWLDPTGGIVISFVIILRWLHLSWEQVKQVTGHTAPPEFIDQVSAIAVTHSTQLQLDVVRAYHVGSRFNVEMEIVLPGDLTVLESHDIALSLQHKIEALEEVERAFVHVDYQSRDAPEHKVERLLLAESSSSVSSLQQRGSRANRSAQQLAV
jgi:cation diffusion facilitator family transporter